MPYSKQTWADGSVGGTPLSAARLNFMETGIDTAHDTADANTASATHLAPGTLAARPAANTVPAGTLYPATDTGDTYRSDGTAWAVWRKADGVLATTSHNPATLETYSTTSTALADVDAVDLAVSFVVPSSGRVNVTLSALGRIEGANANLIWSLREGSADIAGSEAQVSALSTTGNIHFTFMVPLAGLTPGTTKTIKWGWRVAGTGTATMYAGGIAGPTVMEVLAA